MATLRQISLIITVLCLTTCFNWSMERIMLDQQWKIQPATSPDQKPDPAQWWQHQAGDWRKQNGAGKGTDWAKTKRSAIHSLWYEYDFKVEKPEKKQSYFLDFRRIEGDAILWINGRKYGELLRPGGIINVTDYIRAGEGNQLRIFITRDYTGISRGFEQDPLRYITRGPNGRKLKTSRVGLGITAPVTLLAVPQPVGLTGVTVRTSWRKKELSLLVELDAVSTLDDVIAHVTVKDEDGKVALQFNQPLQKIAKGESVQTIVKSWANPHPWEIEDAYHYTVHVELKMKDTVLDPGLTERFGFREIWTEGRKIMVNGHPVRFRIEWASFGINKNSVQLLKQLGRNMIYIQPNPTAWWADWNETPFAEPEMMEILDNAGIAISMPAPGIGAIRQALLKDPVTRKDYMREMRHALRPYRNNPALMMYSVGMNSFNPRDAIHPDTLGQHKDYRHPQANVIREALKITKYVDPTRLVYSHADGNLTDIATSNNYTNWIPLQEREDYLQVWSKKGDMPYIAIEFCSIYNGNFYHNKRFLGTEYAASYFGNEAYKLETEQGLKETVKLSEGNHGHGNSLPQAIKDFPVIWKTLALFTEGTDQAWRFWGAHGWHYFNFNLGYGLPEGMRENKFSRYTNLKEKINGRPKWANPQYDFHSKNMQTLLVKIVGKDSPTDKTHAYYSDELVEKRIGWVWDGGREKGLKLSWKCKDSSGKVIAESSFDQEIQPGEIGYKTITFNAPNIQSYTTATLDVTAKDRNGETINDTFNLQFFPKQKTYMPKHTIALWDSNNETREALSKLVMNLRSWSPGESLKGISTLLIGRKTLNSQSKLPFTKDEINNGLRVIIFEQLPEVWEGFGLTSNEIMQRQMFINAAGSIELEGLAPQDLNYWRGSPSLLPAMKPYRPADTFRGPRAGNRHVLASCTLRVPEVVGFTPLLVTDFDLNYTPLLRWQYGKGAIWFSSLDLMERAGKSPAATKILLNTIKAADLYNYNTSNVLVDASDQSAKDFVRLGIGVGQNRTKPSKGDILLLGRGFKYTEEDIKTFIKNGVKVCGFGLTTPELASLGIKSHEREFVHSTDYAMLPAGVNGSHLRTRIPTKLTLFNKEGQSKETQVMADGLLLRKNNLILCAVTPDQLLKQYKEGTIEKENILPTIIKQRQLQAALLTVLGAQMTDEPASQVARLLMQTPPYKNLNFWQVIGPFYPEAKAKPSQALATAFSAEENAVAGDTNPNFNYTTKDGRKLDFRSTVTANGDGFVDLLKVFKPTGPSLAYAVCELDSKEARTARLRMGVDYWMKVWVNGKEVYCVDHGHGSPKPNRHQVNIDLNKGKNIITIKVMAGGKGMGFWANLSEPGVKLEADGQVTAKRFPLCDPELITFDPYEYHYW